MIKRENLEPAVRKLVESESFNLEFEQAVKKELMRIQFHNLKSYSKAQNNKKTDQHHTQVPAIFFSKGFLFSLSMSHQNQRQQFSFFSPIFVISKK